MKQPDTVAISEGHRGHDIAQAYLETGTAPDSRDKMGRSVLSGLEYLPSPGVATCEGEATFKHYTVTYKFRSDAAWTDGRTGFVIDHKFTANLSFAMTPDELASDYQRIIYAYNIGIGPMGPVDEVWARWVYYKRGKPNKAKPVEYIESWPSIVHRFDNDVHPFALEVALASDNPEDQPRNFGHCYAWNRPCEYMGQCQRGITPARKAAMIMGKRLSRIVPDDDDRDEERGRSRRRDDDDDRDEERGRSRRRDDDDDRDEERGRSRRRDDDDDRDEERPRSRRRDDDDDRDEERPRSRRRDDDEERDEERPRSRRRDDDDDRDQKEGGEETPAATKKKAAKKKSPVRRAAQRADPTPPVGPYDTEDSVRALFLHAAIMVNADPGVIEEYVTHWVRRKEARE